MKERPILFSGAMVRALLHGSKTQTRRIVKSSLEIAAVGSGDDWNRHKAHPAMQNPPVVLIQNDGRAFSLPCPYGQVGDRLYVRETHDVNRLGVETFPDGRERFYAGIAYQADDGRHEADINEHTYLTLDQKERRGWTPSIHMPRWASRITLEVTGVRVERLQAMEGQTAFESDALKEGIKRIHHGDGEYSYHVSRTEPHPNNWTDPCDAFRDLWDSLNAARGYGWVLNPWVWVVEFKRVTPCS